MSDALDHSLRSILRAAHCRSTHHFIAIDALPLVATAAGKRLVSQLMRHHRRYLTGAKDPDVRFRDFQNHVVHVDDGYWGGAPRVAHQWYDRMQRYLRQKRYSDAAHAAGVLSHYFTDPIQPLHTAQTPVEKVLHRPIEWSVTKSYSPIIQQWRADPTRTVFELSDGPGWLGEAILYSARLAHRHYPEILRQYDLVAGQTDPPAGLNDDLRSRFADLLGLAVTGWARVIERAAWDSESNNNRIPTASTTVGIVLAGIRVPDRVWLRRIEHHREQDKVTALVDEFRTTGELKKHLPSEQRVISSVRQIRHRERDYRAQRELAAQLIAGEAAKSADPAIADDQATILPFQSAVQPTAQPIHGVGARLHPSDPLVDAPSIGPKTAARFAEIQIQTVAEFLASDAESVAAKLATRWITPATVLAWQHQSRLMCHLPAMMARETQVLVATGFATVEQLAGADNKALHQSVQSYVETHAGRRVLRGAEPPTLERLTQIISDSNATIQHKSITAKAA